MNLTQYLSEQKSWIEHELTLVLKEDGETPARLREAMAYSLYAGGKRLRPILAIAGCETMGKPRDLVSPLCSALEMIHTYSLIHDDLPSMDNDDLRRGRPTNHKVYGESLAILAGDSLLTEAFTWLAFSYKTKADAGEISASTALQVIGELAKAAGMRGMAGGQVIDLECEGKKGVTVQELEHLHRLKTGHLLEASVSLGARLAGASEKEVKALRDYGASIGLAFQIADDILDIEGGEEIGKPVGSDEARGKTTYPALLGLPRSKALAKEWIDKALSALSPFGPSADPLRAIAHYVVERKV